MNSSNRGIGMTSQRTRDRLVARLREEGIRNEAVLEVIRNTPRHLFVDEALASRAYEDTALPIGYNQTISQPYVVAAMTDLVLRGRPHKVLEIGTGSGYQAAVLAPLVPRGLYRGAHRAPGDPGAAAVPQTGSAQYPRQLLRRHRGAARVRAL